MSEIERLYTLKEAAAEFFSTWESRKVISALRTGIRHGHLVPLRFAGKFCVTETAIREMIARCRQEPKAPASTSESAKDASPSGSSLDSDPSLALAAAQATLQALKKNSRGASTKNTRRQKPAANLIELSSRT